MGFLIVNKNTGEVIKDKIYSTEGTAQAVINKSNLLGKDEWVVIPMPKAETIKVVVDGGWFSSARYAGRLEPSTDWHDEDE